MTENRLAITSLRVLHQTTTQRYTVLMYAHGNKNSEASIRLAVESIQRRVLLRMPFGTELVGEYVYF